MEKLENIYICVVFLCCDNNLDRYRYIYCKFPLRLFCFSYLQLCQIKDRLENADTI